MSITDLDQARSDRERPMTAEEQVERWRVQLRGLREFNVPGYLSDDQVLLAFSAMMLAGELRHSAATEGRCEMWGRVERAIGQALSHESPEAVTATDAERVAEHEADKRRGEFGSI